MSMALLCIATFRMSGYIAQILSASLTVTG